MDDKSGKHAVEYGIVPIDVMASMSGLDFVRAIFARRLPEPPIMQTVEPFDCTVEPGAVVIHSVPGMSETSGVIRTEGRVLNAGRRVATAEARITDAKDRLLAHATTTCLVLEFPKGSAKG